MLNKISSFYILLNYYKYKYKYKYKLIMPGFTSIIDPKTKKPISLFGQEGGSILTNYVNIYKKFRKEISVHLKEDKK
jgi:hypothetical protein